MEMISKSANTLRSLDEIILDEFSHFADHSEDLGRLAKAYEAAKRQKQLLDYDDLLVMLRQLLLFDEAARVSISRQYRHILVDEYQDTNRLQAEVIRQLATTHQNVMVVGDDSQSIYAFRGATFKNIMEFPELFPGTTVYKLEENYRSTQPILNLANSIIEEATEKYTKRLFTRKIDGPLPALVEAAGENAQSRFIAQKILELREEGVPLSEVAVLFRSSFHSFDLEIELSRKGIALYQARWGEVYRDRPRQRFARACPSRREPTRYGQLASRAAVGGRCRAEEGSGFTCGHREERTAVRRAARSERSFRAGTQSFGGYTGKPGRIG